MELGNIFLRLARATRLIPPAAEDGLRPSIGLVIGSSVAINLFAVTIPIVMLVTMDRILPFRAVDTLILLMAGAVFAIIAETLLRSLRSQLTGWSGATFEHSASVDVASRLLAQPLTAFEQVGSGKHLENFSKVSQLRQFFSGQSFAGWIDLPFSIFFVLIIAIISWPIALLLAVGYGAFAVYARHLATRQLAPMVERMAADQRRNNFLIEILSNIHTLKSMAMEALMLRRYDRLQESSARAIERQAREIDASTALIAAFVALIGTLVTSAGALQVIAGDLSRGELSACIFLALRSLGPLQRVGLLWARRQSDHVLGDDVAALLEQPALADAPSDTLDSTFDTTKNAVELTGVSFSFAEDKAPLLSQISFSVPTGSALLIRGENGSGRSTLLGLISGLMKPNEGSVSIFDHNVSEIAPARLNQLVGYLPQRAIMFEGTLLQNATMFRNELGDRARDIALELGFADFILALPQGWETRVGDSAAESLPPGLRQRIGMIRALVTDPDVILFDDATASIDADGEAAIIAYLTKVKGTKTLILVSHRPSLMKLADAEFTLTTDPAQNMAKASSDGPKLAASDDFYLSQAAAGFERLSADAGSEFRANFWLKLDDAVNAAFRTPNDLSRLVAPVLREIGWMGDIRDVIEALPYYAEELDITGLTSAIARLGFHIIERHGDLDAIDDRGYPCLALPDQSPARLLLDKTGNGYVMLEGLQGQSAHEGSLGIGRAVFFERDVTALMPVANWTRQTVSRLRPLLIQASVVSILSGFLLLANALFVTVVFSQVLPTGAIDLLAYALLGVLLSLGLAYALQQYRAGVMAYLAGRVEYLFGTAAIGKLMQLSPSYTERSGVGAQIARLTSFEAIRDLFTSPIASILLEVPATILIAIILCLINPVVLPILVAALAMYALLYLLLRPMVQSRLAAQARIATRRNEFLVEMISKMRGIRESRAEHIWLDRYRIISADASFAAFRTEQINATIASASYGIMMAAGLAVVAFSVPRAFDGLLGAGSIIASLILIWRVLGPMQVVFTNLSRVGRIRVAAQQFDMVMQFKGERLPPELRASLDGVKGQIEFNRVSFRYSMTSDPAVVGLSMDIPPGGMIAITGANGSGKSTIFKLLLGMYAPQAGAIRIDGIDIRQIDPVDLRRLVGYLPQEMEYFRATIAQNLRFVCPDASDEELRDALRIAGVLDQVEALPGGLDYRIGDSASERLPASMRQKMALARAYLSRAPILIFDEPGNGLDFGGDACFVAALKALKGKRTVLFISHRPSHMKLADRVLLFRNGALQGTADPANLFPQSKR